MKHLLVTPLIFCFLSACNSSTENGTKVQEEADSSSVDLQIPELDGDDPAIVMENFPRNWVEIEVTADGLVQHEWCGTDGASVEFREHGDHWEIRTVYGQDGEDWHLIRISANDFSTEEQILQEGVMVVEKITYPDEEIYEVNYFWNKTAGFCTFGDFFNAETQFANAADKANFKLVKEDCDL